MSDKQIDLATVIAQATIKLQQTLDDYYYYVCKLEVDFRNSDGTRRYCPRAGWTWEQCLELLNRNPTTQKSLEDLEKLTAKIKQQEGA